MQLSVLALHGWRTNKEMLAFQMTSLTSSLKEMDISLDLHILNAPRVASGPPDTSITAFFGQQQTFEWWDFKVREKDVYIYDGIEDTIQYIEEYISSNGPFDLLLGFSQGSTLAGILNALYATKKCKDFPWKAVLHCSGALSREPFYKEMILNSSPINIPSIFLLGDSDYLLTNAEELSTTYDRQYQTIFRFKGGHKFPNKSCFDYKMLSKKIIEVCCTR